MEKKILSAWYLLMMGGFLATVFVGARYPLAACYVCGVTYALCLFYGLYRAWRQGKRDLLSNLGGMLVCYGILFVFYLPPTLSTNIVVWVVLGVLAILGLTNLTAGQTKSNADYPM